jgi:hypothetical protein
MGDIYSDNHKSHDVSKSYKKTKEKVDIYIPSYRCIVSDIRVKYEKFTTIQKKYLHKSYDLCKYVGKNDIYVNRIDDIIFNLMKLGCNKQIITHAKIKTWFKNQRYRKN